MKRLIAAVFFILTGSLAVADTVLVTGSNRGIGLQFVTQYAEKGWDVIATSRSPADDADLQALAAAHDNVTIEKLDVTDMAELAALADKYRGTPIDLLVNNAGLLGDRAAQQWGSIEVETFNQLMAVNVLGPLKVSEAFADHVAASKQKKIVVLSSTIGSIASRDRPTPLPVLATSKAAVNMAMQTVAQQLKEQGVTVAMLMPGSVQTRMMHQAFGMSLEEASEKKDFDFQFPTLTPAESVAGMIDVIESLDGSRTGVFLNYDGTEIPW